MYKLHQGENALQIDIEVGPTDDECLGGDFQMVMTEHPQSPFISNQNSIHNVSFMDGYHVIRVVLIDTKTGQVH